MNHSMFSISWQGLFFFIAPVWGAWTAIVPLTSTCSSSHSKAIVAPQNQMRKSRCFSETWIQSCVVHRFEIWTTACDYVSTRRKWMNVYANIYIFINFPTRNAAHFDSYTLKLNCFFFIFFIFRKNIFITENIVKYLCTMCTTALFFHPLRIADGKLLLNWTTIWRFDLQYSHLNKTKNEILPFQRQTSPGYISVTFRKPNFPIWKILWKLNNSVFFFFFFSDFIEICAKYTYNNSIIWLQLTAYSK